MNLKNSFPDKTNQELRTIERKFYRHFTDLLVESVKNLSISKKSIAKRVTVKNPEVLDKLYDKGKSVLLVSGHYNNWEWIITTQNTLFKHKAFGIGKPLTSTFWDKKINARRSRFGMTVIHAGNLKQNLKNDKNNPIATLILGDQSPGDSHKSYWMNFLHQDTAVVFGTEQLANEYDFAVVYFILNKVKRGYYQMELKLVTEEPRTLDWGEITEKHTKMLEKDIQEKPEFWIWTHKRWKREKVKDIHSFKQQQREKFNKRYRSN
jgi:KDO2-lipid IV(A) lauroyltransferase